MQLLNKKVRSNKENPVTVIPFEIAIAGTVPATKKKRAKSRLKIAAL